MKRLFLCIVDVYYHFSSIYKTVFIFKGFLGLHFDKKLNKTKTILAIITH